MLRNSREQNLISQISAVEACSENGSLNHKVLMLKLAKLPSLTFHSFVKSAT